MVFALQLMLDQIEGMRAGDISQADPDFARTALVESFPATFATIPQTLMAFARLEMDKRPRDYYDKLWGRYEKVTLADIKRVALHHGRGPPFDLQATISVRSMSSASPKNGFLRPMLPELFRAPIPPAPSGHKVECNLL